MCAAMTEQDARDRLLAHLWGSPDHADLTEEGRHDIALNADVYPEEWDDGGAEPEAVAVRAPGDEEVKEEGDEPLQPHEPEDPPPAKLRKTGGKGHGKGMGKSENWKKEVASAVAEGVKAPC